MSRLVLFFVAVAILGLGVGWLADRPGAIDIVWQGWRIETSVAVAAGAVIVAFILLAIAWWLIRLVLGGPSAIAALFHRRRHARGRGALTRGFVAVGTGDLKTARRAAIEAERHAMGDPLALVLKAQAAQLGGDRDGAEHAFRAMLDHDATRALGYRGLFVEARRRGDAAAAHKLADEAVRHAPQVPWAGPALLEIEVAAQDWAAALATVERNLANRVTDRAVGTRQRAVLLTAQAREQAARGEEDAARKTALEAVRLAPDLVPAAALAGRLLAESGEPRQAGKIVEAAWKAMPHPDLAEIYLRLRPGDTAQDRLKRARLLADRAESGEEGALALARAAIDAREFPLARRTLAPLVEGRPARRACLLMAEIEDAENGDRGRARGWLARALTARPGPAWVADGIAYDEWEPASPTTGRLDAFRWEVPPEHLAPPGSPLIDAEALAPSAAPAIAPPPAALPPAESAPAAAPAPVPPPRPLSRGPVETVLPLPHLPDDPGPPRSGDEAAPSL
ncbi:MAG TPA: heme biosynthesis HemY N-terminal domain-containing protein [Hyphomicrobiales bacterium]|nr:heme biosynthesis HemY N-terminal domain-containing protein [Hyphomicrobiales bacterium]